MRPARHITKLPVLAAVLAAATLILPAAVHAADGHDAMPGMSAQEHAKMSDSMPGMTAEQHAQMSGTEHDSMPGMTAEQHAQMSGTEHDSMPGMTAEQHAQMSVHRHGSASGTGEPGSSSHPVWLVIGGFALANALVLGYAAGIRRRPAARKRRATLARVRRAAGTATVAPAPATEEQS